MKYPRIPYNKKLNVKLKLEDLEVVYELWGQGKSSVYIGRKFNVNKGTIMYHIHKKYNPEYFKKKLLYQIEYQKRRLAEDKEYYKKSRINLEKFRQRRKKDPVYCEFARDMARKSSRINKPWQSKRFLSYIKEWKKRNPEYFKEWYKNNPEYYNKWKEKNPDFWFNYYHKNKDKLNQRKKERYKNEKEYREKYKNYSKQYYAKSKS